MDQGGGPNPDRRPWERVRSLFGAALEQAPPGREAWLRRQAPDDPTVVAEVLTLLARHDETLPQRAHDESGSRAAQAPFELQGDPAGVPAGLEQVGGYRVLSLLGRGGMGSVFEAEQRTPRRLVALKLVRNALVDDDLRRRFELEGEVLGRLRHPSIAQTYETGTADLGDRGAVPFIAMELIAGARELTRWVREEDPPLPARLELFCAAVDGVEHAHQQGIVHRDLKPANVLVDADGRPKVIDFGLARALDDDSGLMSMHTRTGQIMGTPTYMSPEQFGGQSDQVGLASDVYSLGVMLFELITGELPLDLRGQTLVEAARIVRDEPPRTLAGTGSGTRVRDDLDTIVAKALEKQPERRYDTAAALAADVRRYVRHEPVLARPASALYQLRLFARRHRTLVASLALVLLVAVAAAVVSIGFAVDAGRRAHEAERRSYQAALLSAAEALDAERDAAARELLQGTPERLRGWEYRHLQSRLDRMLPSLLPAEWSLDNVQLSRDGRRVAAHHLDSAPRWVVIDRKTGEELLAVEGMSEHRYGAALSPDGRLLAVLAPDATAVAIHDVDGGGLLQRLPIRPFEVPFDEDVASLHWDPASERLAVSGAGTAIWDARRGTSLLELDGLTQPAWTANGRWLVLIDAGAYSLYDARTLQPAGEPLAFDLYENSPWLLPAPRGQRIAHVMESGVVEIVDVKEGALQRTHVLPDRTGLPLAWAFSSDGRLLAIAGMHQNVVVWDVEIAEVRDSFTTGGGSAHGLAFLPDSGDLQLATDTGRHVVALVRTGSPHVLRGHSSYVYPTAFSPDGGLLLSGGWEGLRGEPGALRFWDARSSTFVGAVGRTDEIVLDATFSPDGRHVAASIMRHHVENSDSALLHVDLATGATSRQLVPLTSGLPESIVFLDDRRVLSVLRHGEVSVYELGSWDVLWTTHTEMPPERGSMGHGPAAVSPGGRLLALGHRDSGIRVIDTDDFSDVTTWTAHDEPIWSLTFTPDGERLVSTSSDDSLAVWDARTGELVARMSVPGSDVLCASVSPDGARIASGGRDGLLRLWDTTTWDNVAQLAGHEQYIYSVDWSPDGESLVTGSGDGTVRLWDTAGPTRRVRARAGRRAALPEIERLVARALTDVSADPGVALQAELDARGADARDRELARQVALAFALDRENARMAADDRGGGDAAPAAGDSAHGVGPPPADQPAPGDVRAGRVGAAGLARQAPAWYRAPRATAPITCDGALDEADWQRAPWTTPFVDIEGAARPLPRFATRARMLWDDEFLYVAAELEEPHVWGTLTEHDSIIYRDNDFEVFLDPEGDGRWYGEVEVNALGTVFDLQLDKPYNRGGRAIFGWTPPDLRTGVTVRGTLNDPRDVDQGWTVELAIPHASLAEHAGVPVPPRAGDTWRINFSRVQWRHDVVDGAYVKRPGVPEDNWVWTPQFQVNMHVPRHWGFVEFVGDEDDGAAGDDGSTADDGDR